MVSLSGLKTSRCPHHGHKVPEVVDAGSCGVQDSYSPKAGVSLMSGQVSRNKILVTCRRPGLTGFFAFRDARHQKFVDALAVHIDHFKK